MTPDTWEAIGMRREMKKKVLVARSLKIEERFQDNYRDANRGRVKKTSESR